MKRLLLVTAAVCALAAGSVWAQTTVAPVAMMAARSAAPAGQSRRTVMRSVVAAGTVNARRRGSSAPAGGA